MTEAKSKPTQAEIKALLAYDPETGAFAWAQPRRGRRGVGLRAGNKSRRGYIIITIDKRRHLGHRLAWLYMTGAWPTHEIDHKNGVLDDNRFCNLREATRQENLRNRVRAKHNRSGVKGVYWHTAAKKWAAVYRDSGRSYHLGLFEEIDAAAAAYQKATSAAFGEFARA